MSHCLALLSQMQRPSEPASQAPSEEAAVASSALGEAIPRQVCSHCGSDRLLLTEETPRPSWRDLLGTSSESCPGWYAQLQQEDDRRFWDGLMGEGFNAWYLETVLESAKEPPPLPPPAVQLYLPGLWPGNSFQLQSF